MLTVYVETTIPSYYFETRTSAQPRAWRDATRRWWNQHRYAYRLTMSRFVFAELEKAPRSKSQKALALVRELPIFDEPPELRRVAEYYMNHQAMPVEAAGDAYHLAIASVHRIDFLLTWNCRHLANANKIRHLSVLNERLGLPMPIITTPLTLLPEAVE